MLSTERIQRDVLGLFECALSVTALELELGPLFLLFICVGDWVPIGVYQTGLFVILLLNDFNVSYVPTCVPLHTIPHAVSLVVYVVDPVAIDFGSCVDNLARPDPLLVILLILDECLDVSQTTEIVHFKCVLRVDFLKNKDKSESVNWLLDTYLCICQGDRLEEDFLEVARGCPQLARARPDRH